ncbi:MAG TPA: hypothetical protein VIY70_03770 [Acidimicrobiia bacterium]
MEARVVTTYGTRTEADVAVARLAAEGIPSTTVSDSVGGLEPQLDFLRGVRLVVADRDLLEAAMVLGVDVPEPLPELTHAQQRVVGALQWMAFGVAGFGLLTVLWRAFSG